MKKQTTIVRYIVTDTLTGEETTYLQDNDKTIFLNYAINHATKTGRYFAECKYKHVITLSEYEQILDALSDHIKIVE